MVTSGDPQILKPFCGPPGQVESLLPGPSLASMKDHRERIGLLRRLMLKLVAEHTLLPARNARIKNHLGFPCFLMMSIGD